MNEEREAALLLDINLQELQQEDQYEAVTAFPDDDEVVDFDEAVDDSMNIDISEDKQATITSTTAESIMAPPSHHFSTAEDDPAEPIPHPRTRDLKPSKFKLALGLWCEDTGISRSQYSSLYEILQMLGPHPELAKLPESLRTLKNHTKGNLPLLQLMKRSIPLIPEKLPTSAETKKAAESGNMVPTENLYFFEPATLFRTFLSSDLMKKMHVGMAEFVDTPSELWHSNSWAASVRTTSGQYAHYPNGKPLFPSDFLWYRCLDTACTEIHLGRALAVGVERRSRSLLNGQVVIKVQQARQSKDLSDAVKALMQPPLHNQEVVLLFRDFLYLPESSIIVQECVQLLYTFGDKKVKSREDFPNHFFVRRLIDDWDAPEEVQLLCHTAPVRAELELRHYTRNHFVTAFDQSSKCISVPLLTFIDGFGLYRNSYRSLMGMYLIFAALSFRERARRANVLPLTLGPHGSNFGDVVNALGSLASLEEGLILNINGEDTLVCAFTLCFIGDMPQQQENAGFKSQRATLGCRFCFVQDVQRGDLDYDTTVNGRYHHQVVQMRKEMDALLKTDKAKYAQKWGLSPEAPALIKLSPALDVILTRPADPAHSEFNGLAKQMHTLLLRSILTTIAGKEYAAQLRQFPFPTGYSRLQSPLHHLKSYSLSDHGRWAMVIPVLLRCWLTDSHLSPRYREALQQFGLNPVWSIVKGYAAMAKSTSCLMSDCLNPLERANLGSIVKAARRHYQTLLDAAINATGRGHRASAHVSRSPSPMGALQAIEPMLPLSQVSQTSVSANTAEQYNNDKRRPNVHTALH